MCSHKLDHLTPSHLNSVPNLVCILFDIVILFRPLPPPFWSHLLRYPYQTLT
jgi:hypothetical protein